MTYFKYKDESSQIKHSEKIIPHGPEGFNSVLPQKQMTAAIPKDTTLNATRFLVTGRGTGAIE